MVAGLLLVLTLAAWAGAGPTQPAGAAWAVSDAAQPALAASPAAVDTAPAVSQCNPPDFPITAGYQVTCSVHIVNDVSSTGVTSSTVTISACLAAAGVVYPSCPENLGPVVSTTSSTQLVTSVNQCNGIVTGGGSNVYCDVTVTNNVPVGTLTTGVTVNQCNASGTGGGSTIACDPSDVSTTNATVTQCNASATGGGTYAGETTVACTVTGAVTALPVTVNQCNGTATGGGSAVTCATTIANNFLAVAPTTTTPPAAGSGAGATTVPGPATGVTTAPGSGSSAGSAAGSAAGSTGASTVVPAGSPSTGAGGAARAYDRTDIGLGVLALAGAGAAAALARRRRRVLVGSGDAPVDG